MRVRLALPLLFLLGLLALLGLPGDAHAQGIHDTLLDEAACLTDINSQECICARVRILGKYPLVYDDPVTAAYESDTDGDGIHPRLNADGYWEDGVGPAPGFLPESAAGSADTELEFRANDNYKDHCALSYWREDMRRLYRFLVVLGVGFAAISLGWAGVMWMQASSSGEDLRQVRLVVIRVFMGMVILATAYVIYEGASDLLMDRVESWSLDRDTYYDIR